MTRSLYSLLLIFGMFGSACDGADDKPREGSGVLKEYVRTPLDRAQSVSDSADDRTDTIDQALEEAEGEEDE